MKLLPRSSARTSPQTDYTALALLGAMLLALAVTMGASLSAVGSGALQEALRSLGWGRNAEIIAEQNRQRAALAAFEQMIQSTNAEIGALNQRTSVSESRNAATIWHLSKVDGELLRLKSDVQDVKAAREDALELRSTIDEMEKTARKDVAAITKRLDKLEQAIDPRDTTSSVPRESRRLQRSPEFLRALDEITAPPPVRGNAKAPASKQGGHLIDIPPLSQ
jgi:hypothetical protein